MTDRQLPRYPRYYTVGLAQARPNYSLGFVKQKLLVGG